MQKMFSSVIFLYFACLLPAIAFGVLNDDNTNGGISEFFGIFELLLMSELEELDVLSKIKSIETVRMSTFLKSYRLLLDIIIF